MIAYADGTASPALLRLQAVQKELAAQLFAWCERHGLTAFLVCGSALGAVRHGDVIPWDDDIDLGLLRADFERLFDCYARDPLPGICLQSHRTDPGYPYPFAKLRIDGTCVTEPAGVSEVSHHGIFVDLFPFDSLPRSALLRGVQQAVLGLLNLFIMPASPRALAATASPLLRRARRAAGWLRPALQQRALPRWRDWWAQLPRASKSDIVDSFGMYGIRFGPQTAIARAVLVPPQRVQFGEITAWLPREPATYLTALFGDFQQLPSEDRRLPGHITAVEFGPTDKEP